MAPQSRASHRQKDHLPPIPQPPSLSEVMYARFSGLCSQDGCGEAPRDGFMASRERSNMTLLNLRDTQI